MTLSIRRASTIGAVVAILVAMVVADAAVGRPAGPRSLAAAAQPANAVVPAAAGSSSWFCVGGSGPNASAEETVVIVNSTSTVVRGTVTAVPSKGPRRTVKVVVPAGGMSAVIPASVSPGPSVSAIVQLDRGGVAVDETVVTPIGWSESPCASSTSSSWYFASASTAGNDGVLLSILNPGVAAAVVDTALTTAAGSVLTPAPYQGVTVPPGALVTEYLSNHDEGDPSVAVTVKAVSGTVVAAELQSYTAPQHTGVALDTGAPEATTQWVFPITEEVPGGAVSFHVYDPGARAAHVTLRVGFAGGEASPITVVVPAHGAATIDTGRESRLPVGTPYWVRVTSAGGTGIVVAREVVGPAGSTATTRHGLVLGTPSGARQWLVPAITGPGTSAWAFAVQDLAGRPVMVRITSARVAAGASVQAGSVIGPFKVSPGSPRVMLTPSSPVGVAPIVVSANGPIAVELDPEPIAAPGIVVDPAVPLG